MRAAALESAVRQGDRRAAQLVLAPGVVQPERDGPGTAGGRLRAAALEVLTGDGTGSEANANRAVAAYLRGGQSLPPVGQLPAHVRVRESAAALRTTGVQSPAVVVTFPGFHANPYARLMDRAFPRHGLAPVYVDDPREVSEAIAAARAVGSLVVAYLNAPDRLIAKAGPAPGGCGCAAANALELVDSWIRAGALLAMTLHNGPRLSGVRGRAEQMVTQALVRDRAAFVHVMTLNAPQILAPWIELDSTRLVHVAHPNYDAAYGPIPDRAGSRLRLGLSPGDDPVVFSMLGMLAQRKGAGLLIDALDLLPQRLEDGREVRLLLAGMPAPRGAEDLIARATRHPRVISRFEYLMDDELLAWVAATDVAVVPYSQILNSGWLHLALSFGRPVIAPAGGTADEIVNPSALLTFHPDDPGSLAGALLRAHCLANPAARAAARASVEGRTADAQSEALAGALRRLVDGARRAVRPAEGAER